MTTTTDTTPEADELPQWLRDAIRNPPPPPDPAELERSARAARFGEASAIRDRLPRFLATSSPEQLLSGIRDQNFAALAKAWSLGQGNVLLLGESDTGKSSAIGMLMRRALHDAVHHGGDAWEMMRGLVWARPDKLVAAQMGHPMGKGDCPFVRAAARAPVLVLDDLGWEPEHETAKRMMGTLLADRFELGGCTTLITSGLTLGQIRARYGDAVVKRMLRSDRRAPTVHEAFPKLAAAEAKERAAKARPPGDQAELARRQGETL